MKNFYVPLQFERKNYPKPELVPPKNRIENIYLGYNLAQSWPNRDINFQTYLCRRIVSLLGYFRGKQLVVRSSRLGADYI